MIKKILEKRTKKSKGRGITRRKKKKKKKKKTREAEEGRNT